MKKLLTTFALLCIALVSIAQNTILISDFESMNNTSWKGTLTYKDYQSGKSETIESTMQCKIEGDRIIRNIQYIYEPNKNNKSSVKIKKSGTYFVNEKVVSFSEENGTKTLVTTYKGKDNGKKADMFMIHILTNTTYTVTKEVSFLDSNERFVRNIYKYTKI